MIILFLCKEFILTDYIFLARLGQLTLILLLYCHCYILPFIFVIVYIKVVFLSAVADDAISKRGLESNQPASLRHLFVCRQARLDLQRHMSFFCYVQ